VEVNTNQVVFDGIPLFISENQVVLSPGTGDDGYIPSKYFRSVFDIASGKYLH
jgi:hypothetical protein